MPDPVVPVVGDVLYLWDGTFGEETKKHRRVVVACDATEAIIVSICTSHSDENTCPIAIDEMDEGVLTVPSYVNYGEIRETAPSGLAWELSKEGNKKLSRCSDALLARIIDGLRADPRVRPRIKAKFGWIPPKRRILPG